MRLVFGKFLPLWRGKRKIKRKRKKKRKQSFGEKWEEKLKDDFKNRSATSSKFQETICRTRKKFYFYFLKKGKPINVKKSLLRGGGKGRGGTSIFLQKPKRFSILFSVEILLLLSPFPLKPLRAKEIKQTNNWSFNWTN